MSDREQIIETLKGLKKIQPKVIEKDIDEAIELIELLRAYENRPNDKYWYDQGISDERKRIIEELEKEYNIAEEEKRRCASENQLQFDYAKGYSIGIWNAVEIVRGEVNENE